jgi:hypothetical protein
MSQKITLLVNNIDLRMTDLFSKLPNKEIDIFRRLLKNILKRFNESFEIRKCVNVAELKDVFFI